MFGLGEGALEEIEEDGVPDGEGGEESELPGVHASNPP